MGLMNFDVLIKNMKMRSNSRRWCLFILLFTVVISLANADDRGDSRSGGGGADHLNRKNVLQFKTKNNNRDLSEISVEKQRAHQHHLLHHRHHQQQQQQLQHQHQHHHHHHHHRHDHNVQNSALQRSRSSGNYHKQQQQQPDHQSIKRIPDGNAHQAHSSKKYSHYDDDNASSLIGGGVYDTKTHQLEPQHHHRHHHQFAMTTQGPFGREYNIHRNNARSWSVDATNTRNWSDNFSRGRQAPPPSSSSNTTSILRNGPYNVYQNENRRHFAATTTTTTTTTTPAPDFPEKVSFDGFDIINNIESDEADDLNYLSDDENIRSLPYKNAPVRHNIKPAQQSSLHYQRDDPVGSVGYNGITTNAFHAQHSSNGGANYPLKIYNDESTNNKQTMEPTKSFVDEFETRPTTRNTRTIASNAPGQRTQEKNAYRNPDKVEETFRVFYPRREVQQQALRHFNKVRSEYRCKDPRPVLESPPHNVSVIYKPSNTIVHRCRAEFGCCLNADETCQPKHITEFEEYFFISSGSSNRNSGRATTNFNMDIRSFKFFNHTECECRKVNAMFPSVWALPTIQSPTIVPTPPPTTTPAPRCICPNYFTNTNGLPCKCDCASQTHDQCNRLKMGAESFSINERKCIKDERCARPTCAFGEYNVKYGQCPRESDWAPLPN